MSTIEEKAQEVAERARAALRGSGAEGAIIGKELLMDMIGQLNVNEANLRELARIYPEVRALNGRSAAAEAQCAALREELTAISATLEEVRKDRLLQSRRAANFEEAANNNGRACGHQAAEILSLRSQVEELKRALAIQSGRAQRAEIELATRLRQRVLAAVDRLPPVRFARGIADALAYFFEEPPRG